MYHTDIFLILLYNFVIQFQVCKLLQQNQLVLSFSSERFHSWTPYWLKRLFLTASNLAVFISKNCSSYLYHIQKFTHLFYGQTTSDGQRV